MKRQHGNALWLLLILTGLLAGYNLARHAPMSTAWRDRQLQQTLARAKETLIARAVSDDNRPGSLPCPDLITDSNGLNNHPGDGKADMFTLTQCPSYVGWLPWITLDLPEPLDDGGNRLWYALAPALRDDDSAQPINSDTATGLWLDGQPEPAALIIAPRAMQAGQRRPSNNPRDYLDGENANGDDRHYVSGPGSERFNDLVLPISRQELMAATEKRVAGEVRRCLEQHAASPANTTHRQAWPAPLSSNNFQGRPGSLFGRIPDTQTSSGLESTLQDQQSLIGKTLQSLSASSIGAQQVALLNTLAEQLTSLRNLFDTVFSVGNRLKQNGDLSHTQFLGIGKTANDAGKDGRVSRTEGSQIRSQGAAGESGISTLLEQIEHSGLDVFPGQLEQLAQALAQDKADALPDIQAVNELLRLAHSQRSDFTAAIELAKAVAASALTANLSAGQTPGDHLQEQLAKQSVSSLQSTLLNLKQQLLASRINRLSSDIRPYLETLMQHLNNWRGTPDASNSAALSAALAEAQYDITPLSSGLPAIQNLQSASINALQTAASSVMSGAGNNAIETASSNAISQLGLLVQAIAANEASDNNLTHSSLHTATQNYQAAQGSFTSQDTATPRPVQRDLAPLATAVGDSAVDIAQLAKLIADNALLVAPLAKALPVASGSDPGKAAVVETSAYHQAELALYSITGKNQSLAQLQAYLANPDSSRRDKASTALGETLQLAQATLNASNALSRQLSATTASALPTLWFSARCDFLRNGGWWQANRWQDSIFYQISGPLLSAPGRLTVNRQGNYQLVVVAAGGKLAGQTAAPGSVGNFLEDANADPSREGDALTPASNFVARPLSPAFNDRLAH